MSRLRPFWILSGAVALLLSGCHLVLGPDDGVEEFWYYCDASGCYRCTIDGCEIPGSHCLRDGDCPANYFCDLEDNVCRTKTTCKVSAECGSGNVCVNGQCVPGRQPCTDRASCGAGAYCSNGTCKDSGLCTTHADCAKLGTSFVCESGTCVPGTPPVKTCTTGSTCTDGICLDAQCGSCSGDCGGGRTCQYNKHCGAGRVCLDGRCTSSCVTSTDCGSGQVCKTKVCVGAAPTCTKSAECASGLACVNGSCVQSCTATGQCTSAKDVCSASITVGSTSSKVCLADHRAKPECKVNKDCTGGELCVNGVCRTVCAQSVDCAACPDGPVCGSGGFCMTAEEAEPKCQLNSQCSGGQYCLNARCVSL